MMMTANLYCLLLLAAFSIPTEAGTTDRDWMVFEHTGASLEEESTRTRANTPLMDLTSATERNLQQVEEKLMLDIVVVAAKEASTFQPESVAPSDATVTPTAEVSTGASTVSPATATESPTMTASEGGTFHSTFNSTEEEQPSSDFATLPLPPPIVDTDLGLDDMVVTCGTKTCQSGEYCCNSSCSICAPMGSMCIQAACEPCGPATCMPGDVCCNSSCGICTAPQDPCSQAICDSKNGSPQGDLRFLRRRL